MKKVYLITYELYNGHRLIKAGKIRVKNKDDEFSAKCSLENYLKKKFKFSLMKVLTCKDVSFAGQLDALFNGVFK